MVETASETTAVRARNENGPACCAVSSEKQATLYRMVTDEHICPFGLKAKALLERQGFEVDDHHLEDREQTDAFKREHDVETTPQVWIGDRRIGGYDALREYFGKETESGDDEDDVTYQPVIALFAVAFWMAVALVHRSGLDLLSMDLVTRFVAISMCILAILKLRDLEAFSNQFLGYDLLAQRWVRYAYVYPFAEAFAGVGMLAMVWPWVVAPVSLFIGTVGAVSVFKAVYVDRRDLKCACVGGNSDVPLGFVSLTENLMMMFMGAWMLWQAGL